MYSARIENQTKQKDDNYKEIDIKKEKSHFPKAKIGRAKKQFLHSKLMIIKKSAYKEGLESVENSGIVNTAKQEGDDAPDFTLNNALGKPVTMSNYLKKGKVI